MGSAHGYPSKSFTVGRRLGDVCTTGSQCQSTYCADGVCCNTACTGQTCQTCGTYSSNGTGTCGYVNNSSQDPRNECAQGSSSSDGCRSNNCSGNGYSCGIQTIGDGGCSTCKTCVGATSIACVNYATNTQDVGCNGTCYACQSGICGVANAGTDPGNLCTPGSTASDGCRSDYCAGGTASCGFQTSGEGGCPICKYCQGAVSSNCVNRTDLTQDTTSPNTCSGVNICWNGGCTLGKYYLYLTTNYNYDGNLAGGYPSARWGADTRCINDSGYRPSYCKGTSWAFLSIDSSDYIRNFSNQNNPNKKVDFITLPWYWAKGATISLVIANNFDDLFDGAINYNADTVGYDHQYYWTGSDGNGNLSDTCNVWSYNSGGSYRGRAGESCYNTNGYWLNAVNDYCPPSYANYLLCACLGI